MNFKRNLAAAFALLTAAGTLSAFAQTPCPTQVLIVNPTTSKDLVCLVPQVYGAGGLVGRNNGGPLDITTGHAVHFQASSVRSFGPINSEIGTQISQLPLAAPVSGFVFSGGVVTPNATYGPILTDRAETLGKGKIFLGASYQYFNFDKADGVNLKSFGAVFTHEPEPQLCASPNDPTVPCFNGVPIFQNDIIATQNRIDLKVHQVTLVGTAGVTDKLDVTLAIPVLNVRMAVASSAQIFAFEAPPTKHIFNVNGAQSLTDSFSDSGYSFGMGDITIRTKYLARQTEKASLALGADIHLPTGDAYNFLGAGTWGFRPFVIYTGHTHGLTPHATIGFQGNGESILAGDVTTQTPTKAHLPDVATYTFGIDGAIHHKIGYAIDYLGESILHGSLIANSTFTDYGGARHADVTPTAKTVNLASLSAGIKARVSDNLLVSFNVLTRLNDAGLHAKPTPLVGISYSF